jgi:hypothetical protein
MAECIFTIPLFLGPTKANGQRRKEPTTFFSDDWSVLVALSPWCIFVVAKGNDPTLRPDGISKFVQFHG